MTITNDTLKFLFANIIAYKFVDINGLQTLIDGLDEAAKGDINNLASGKEQIKVNTTLYVLTHAEGMAILHFVLKNYIDVSDKTDEKAAVAARIIKGLVDAGANLETVTGTGAKFKGTDVVGKSFLVLLLEHYSAAPKLVEQVFKTLDSTTLYNKLTQDGDVKTAYEAALKALSNDNDKEVAFKAATIDLVTPPASSILTFTSSVAIAGAIMVAIFAYVYWHSYGDSNSYDEEVTDTDNGEHSSDAMMDGPSGN